MICQHQQPLNQPNELIGDNDCDFSLLEPLPLDAFMSTSSSDLLSGFMMDDIFSPIRKSKRQRRRVSFQEPPAEVKVVPSFACLGEAERRSIWYTPAEIEHFRSKARHACRALRKNPMAYPQESTRGLELRTSFERQWRKHLTLACIVKAQMRYPHIDPYHLAELAHDCNKRPRKEAVAQGMRDFCAVYYPVMDESPVTESLVLPSKPANVLSTVAETPALQHRCLSRLQKRSSPMPACHYNEEAPLAKRHCPMMDRGVQFQEAVYSY